MQIIPAIIPKNQTELVTKAKQVLGLVSHVQVDVCDGKFVKSKTQFHELPFLDELEYELDLMIDQPELTIEDYIEMQPARIIVHLESVQDFPKLFLPLERVRGIIEIGLCINNDTDESVLEQYLDDVDFIQVMGIAEIGSQGQPFDERCLNRINYLHRKYPEMPISVDGSVNSETIARLRDAGATRFVAGSAVFGTKDVEGNIERLKDLLL
jgi:ribulose-phosphate 3-epimerase